MLDESKEILAVSIERRDLDILTKVAEVQGMTVTELFNELLESLDELYPVSYLEALAMLEKEE
jgi:predicted HTH domain antitoxin